MLKSYKDKKLPFFELNYSNVINGCSKSHVHDKLTFVYVEKGSILIPLKNKDLILKSKQLALINPYEIHSVSKQDENSTGLYALYLDILYIEKLQKKFFRTPSFSNFSKSLIEDETLCNDFYTLCLQLKKEENSLKKEETILEFISKIILLFSIKKEEKKDLSLANDIKKYLDRNLDLDISLEELAKEFLISPYYLIRIFKEKFSLTPYQYILNQKINLAKKLLSEDLVISQVAKECGFSDQSHLYKYFKDVFSVSPKEYQESLKK